MANISAKPLPGAPLSWVYYGHRQSRGLTNSPVDCWFRRISGLRAAATRRLASETRLRAQCGAVALFESSHGQHKQKVPSRGTARDLLLMGHKGLEPPTKRL